MTREPVPSATTRYLLGRPLLEPAQAILALLLVLEIVVFSLIGTNFASLANGFEVLRLCVEIGLLALALTPVITSGGIDLSVGSLMGLSAVVFGKLWRDGGMPTAAAAGLALCLGASGGFVNGFLITRGRISSADRDSRFLLPVPGAGRGSHRRRRQLHPVS